MHISICKVVCVKDAAVIICIITALTSCVVERKHIDVASDDIAEERLSANLIDNNAGLTKQDYKNILSDTLSRQGIGGSAPQTPAIPQSSLILSAPMPPELEIDKLVSISITEDIPLKNALMELGRLAEVDMEIDAGISGGIIIQASSQPFDEVIRRIADLGKLRYKIINGSIKIERDLPYQVNYVTDFLNITRSGSGAVNTGSVIAAKQKNVLGSVGNIQSSYDGDLWKSVGNGIRSLLTSAYIDPSSEDESFTDTFVNINKQAGIISVMATEAQHKDIKEYLEIIAKSVSSQVLIEAKIVEVTLNENYTSGIDWKNIVNSKIGFIEAKNLGGFDNHTASLFTIPPLVNGKALTLSSAINMLDKFGVSRTLSSPRLHTMNNQQAVLTFAKNEVYFTISAEEQVDAGNDDTKLTIQSNLNTVPVGVTLSLQPSINLSTNEITMNIKPTLSRIVNHVRDPGVDIIIARQKGLSSSAIKQFANVKNEIPIVEVRELDSILKVKSGGVMVVGGLMRDVSINTDIKAGAKKSKAKQHINEVVETIIFIKATILPSGKHDSVVKADRDLYYNFTRDSRPLAF